uniref:Uncharacterized protein n=1 Tax=Pyxicephalus adspersus TaxID=30357 RepID=A0AAV3B1Q3_PYXAD|nr:TPA: hypothetical protein GDO54_007735 [Pyxicephalus adspersus]
MSVDFDICIPNYAFIVLLLIYYSLVIGKDKKYISMCMMYMVSAVWGMSKPCVFCSRCSTLQCRVFNSILVWHAMLVVLNCLFVINSFRFFCYMFCFLLVCFTVGTSFHISLKYKSVTKPFCS